MSGKVKILPDDLVNKIAAGEVVERPASVVKELVENSIDAGATRITIEVKAAGARLIRVADNGAGMSREDAVLALKRHATSKLQNHSSLTNILTLGFRGEALPSIASVSQLVLETCQAEDVAGTRIVAEAGAIKDVSDVGRDTGTTVTVQNLFFNTPVRRKFLKAEVTEMRHITAAISNLALAYPEISFRLLHEERELLYLERHDSYRNRAEGIFGKTLLEKTVSLLFRSEGLGIEGLLGKPEIAKTSRAHQLLFVNGRPIISRLLTHAVIAGYGSLLPKDAHPFFLIFLHLDPHMVDVNVHPTKKEVRFSKESLIHDQLFRAVRHSLHTGEVIPEVRLEGTGGFERLRASAQQTSFSFSRPVFAQAEIGKQSAAEQGTTEQQPPVSMWQLHQKYILAPIKNGLIVVDQHAAAERVIYEEAMQNLEGKPGTAQQLLFPLVLELTPAQLQVMEDIAPLLELMGFGIRQFGPGTVVVDAIPAGLKHWGHGETLVEIIDEVLNSGGVSSGLKQRLAASYACKTAIKTGDKLSPQEMQALIDQLFATRQPFSCPHGRPTLIKIPLEEFDHRFGR
ncbi:MAG: DNA mismatch repair endonuclease MutL [Candidatus Latescibacteria bacterium]|nr:DNA mismatch repair endonuclease MutL [Candidatus Latescibacterota bacterium]